MKRCISVLLMALLVFGCVISGSAQALSTDNSNPGLQLDKLLYLDTGSGVQQAASLSSPGIPTVTKSPTGETVTAGGGAYFIAKGTYWSSIVWHFGPNTGTEQLVTKIAEQFPGVVVIITQNEEKLYLGNIPYGMNGWRISAELVGRDGTVFTSSAPITVLPKQVDPPRITSDPKGAELKPDETTILRVEVAQPEKGDLIYQWYKSTTPSATDAWKITGATDPVYVPEYSRGTFYYYCAVYVVDGTETSVAAKSKSVAVTYASREAVPSEEEPAETAPAETTLPAETQPAVSESSTEPVSAAAETSPVVTPPSETAKPAAEETTEATEAATQAEPAASESETEAPETEPAVSEPETAAPETEPAVSEPAPAKDKNSMILIAILVVALALICFLVVFFVLHFSGRRKTDEFDSDDSEAGETAVKAASQNPNLPKDEPYDDLSDLNLTPFMDEENNE